MSFAPFPIHSGKRCWPLGATRWETINRVVLPYCRSGLVGAVILGLGRALGETMAVTMVIGNSYAINRLIIFARRYHRQQDCQRVQRGVGAISIMGSLVELALVLFAITLMVNIIARLLVWRTDRRSGRPGSELRLTVFIEAQMVKPGYAGFCGLAAAIAIILLL